MIKRRAFLKSTASGLFLASAPFVLGQNPPAKFRTALIGCGWWGKNILREALGSDVPKTRIADFATHQDGLAALEGHKIDAYFADRALLFDLASRARNPSALAIGNRLFTHEPYGIALKQDDSAFRLLVDQTLTDVYQSDDFPKLLTTYFGDEGPILRREIMMQSIPQ